MQTNRSYTMTKRLLAILFFIPFISYSQNLRKIEELKNALPLAEGISKANILSELAMEHAHDTIAAFHYLSELQSLDKMQVSGDIDALYLLSLGNVRQINFQYDQALTLFQKADSIYKTKSDKKGQARATIDIGATYIKLGRNEESLPLYYKGLRLAKDIGDSLHIMKVYNNLGYAHYRLGNSDSSLYYFYKVIPYCDRNTADVCFEAYNHLGIMYSEIGEPQKAISYHKKSLAIKSENKDTLMMATSHMNIAGVYFFQNQFDSCLYFLQQATDLYNQTGNIQGEILCNNNLAAINLETGNPQGAIKPAKQALRLARQIQDMFIWCGSYQNLGDAYFKLGNYRLAQVYADSALPIALDLKSKYLAQQHYDLKSRIMKAKGDYLAAYDFRELYHSYSDSILNENKTKQIAALETQYETEKKEKEIELQASLLREQELAINRNQIILIASVVVFILLIAFIYIWFNRRRLKQQAVFEAERALLKEGQVTAVIESQEKERSRFAKDLHDGFGQLISALRLNINRLKETDMLANDVSVKSNEMLDEMYTSLKSIAFDLMPQTLINKGISEALDELASQISQSGTLAVTVRSLQKSYGLGDTNKLAVYRIIQEIVNNIIKYADATKIEINLTDFDNGLNIMIEDDGKGFDPISLQKGKGNGWKNIQSRLDMIHGEIDLDSHPGRKGTTVSIDLPLYVQEEAA